MRLSSVSADTRSAIPPSDIYVAFDTDEIGRELGATIQQLRTAADRAARKTRNWLHTQLLRELAARMAIPQGGLKTRFRRKQGKAFSDSTGYAVLWIGLNSIEAQNIGNPRQLKKGVRVKQWLFDKAFIADVYGPGEKVWRRMGRQRFPVVKMTVPISQEMEELIQKYEPLVARKFEEIFEHELKFAMGWFS